MRILMATAGTRGDVEPFVRLARHAVRRGHRVRLAVPQNSGADLGDLDTVLLAVDFAQLIQTQGVSPWAALRTFKTTIRPAMAQLLQESVKAILDFGPDVVVHHPKILTAATTASALAVPSVVVEAVPSVTPTRAFPAPGVLDRNLGWANRLTYAAAPAAARVFAREMAAAEALLPAAGPRPTGRDLASLVPISPLLLSRPADWPDAVHLTGDWCSDTTPPPLDPLVRDFISAGPFLYAGFGSMAAGDAGLRSRAILQAARRSGLRALLVTGWGGLEVPKEQRGDDVLAVAAVPHSAVLPRAVLAVHHGGAGTVHAVARAGIPSVVVPFLVDQPFWARQLQARHLAPTPVPYRKVTSSRMHDAISAALQLRPEAARTGELMRSERGLDRALDVLERLAQVRL